MDKQAKIAIKYLAIFALIVSVLIMCFVFASHDVSLDANSVDEDITHLYNITINNTDSGQAANITQVNITLSGNFNFTADTNGTDALATFSNTSTVLSWTNSSGYVINGSENKSFWFNATAYTPGIYNITVTTLNSSGTQETIIPITVNDKTAPAVTIVYPANATNYSLTSIDFNLTVVDNNRTDSCWYTLTDGVANSTMSNTSVTAWNATNSSIGEGTYTAKFYCNDSDNNINNSEQATFTIDTTYPLISYGVGTHSDRVNNLTEDFIYVNVSVTETNEDTITFNLYYFNSTSVNSTSHTDSTRTINWTGLTTDETYYYNVTVNDSAGNSNTTATYRISLNDSTNPLIDYGTLTESNIANISQSNVYINVSVTEKSEDTITFNLYYSNSTSLNSTSYADETRTINWTGLDDGVYYYNVTVNDSAGNSNTTEIYKITLDIVAPSISLSKSSSTKNSIIVSYSCSDTTSNVSSCSLSSSSGTVSGSTISGLNCGNSYTITVTAGDYAGNSLSSSPLYSTSGCSSSGTYTSPSWTKTYVVTDEQFEEGYTKELAKKHRFKIKIDTTYHYIGVTELTSATAKIDVSSTVQQATLSIGDIQKFDVTEDGYYDLSVKLNGIEANKADISIKSIREKVTEEVEAEEEEKEELVEEVGEIAEEKGLTWLWVLIIVIVVLVLIGVGYGVKKKKE